MLIPWPSFAINFITYMIMKNLVTIIACISGLFLLRGCGSKKDPVTYNNQLIMIMNDNEKYMSDMNAAMDNADYIKAGKVQKEWEADLEKQLAEVEAAGDFNGDDVLLSGVRTGVKTYQKIVKEDYPKLIAVRSRETGDPQTEQQLLNSINSAFETAGSVVNKAAAAFEKKYAK